MKTTKQAKPVKAWRWAADLGNGWLRVMPENIRRADAKRYAQSCGPLRRVRVEIRVIGGKK